MAICSDTNDADTKDASANAMETPHGQENSAVVPEKQPRRRGRKRKIVSEEEKARKRSLFLKRNRLAASRCRSRRKSQADTFKEDLVVERQRNVKMKEEADELNAKVGQLRALYMQCERKCGNSQSPRSF